MSQSSAPKKIIFPLDDEAIRGLRAGDPVLITGTMLTARDAAHKRLYALLEQDVYKRQGGWLYCQLLESGSRQVSASLRMYCKWPSASNTSC